MISDVLSTSELEITPGWMNAAGMLGFYPPLLDKRWQPPVAFVTNPISAHHRNPAESRGVVRFEGGLLFHSGWPNPGLRRVLKEYAARWARSVVPVWVHLIAEDAAETRAMVRRLENVEGVRAVELSLSPAAELSDPLAVITAARGELPLIVQVGVDQIHAPWVQAAAHSGIQALSLGAPRGKLLNLKGDLAEGRIYGPAIYPFALKALENALAWDCPVIAGGGIFSSEQAETALRLGAAAVQVDIALWGEQPMLQ